MSAGQPSSTSQPRILINKNLESLKSEYQKVKHPSAVKLIPLARNTEERDPSLTELTKTELMEYINDPFWRNVRRILLGGTIFIFVLFLVAAISMIYFQSDCFQSALSEGNSTYRTGD